jgi:hypothetical protein
MFQFPSLPSVPYGFRYGYARITTRGFPHSEIPGSKVGQHLPRAYRSRPRPSSALGAKASTVCPSSLDHGRTLFCVAMEFSRCARAGARPTRERTGLGGRSLKTQQRTDVEVDVISRRAATPDDPEGSSNGHSASGVRAPASLERR